MISLSGTFEETAYNSDGSVSWHDEWDIGGSDSQDTIDEIKDALSAVGISIGFGSEYYFSDGFSLGGEFGIRLMKFSQTGILNFEEEDGGELYSRDILSNDMALTLGLSYSTLSLNYYF